MPPKSRSNSPAPYECTASNCKTKIRSSLEANIHPLVGSLVCRKCFKSYGDGDFASIEGGVDDLGDDNYCRWCVDGGDLFGCSNEKSRNNDRCHYSFCRDCIALNIPDDPILSSDGNQNPWFCYGCEPEKIRSLREAAEAAIQDLKEREDRQKQLAAKKDSTKDSTKEKPKEQPKTIEIHRREPLLREKSKIHLTPTKVSESVSQRQKPLILGRTPTDLNKKDSLRDKSKSQQEQEPNSKKEIFRDKAKEQSNQSESDRRESSKDKYKEYLPSNSNKTSKEKTKETQHQDSIKEVSKEKGTHNQSETSKKDTSRRDSVQQDKLREPSPSVGSKSQNQQSSSSNQQLPQVLQPKEFIKDIKSYNQAKKRKHSDSRQENPSKVYQDCFADTLNIRSENNRVKSVPLTKEDLTKRLEDYRKVGNNCVREIDIKFGKIVDMFTSEKETSDAKKRKLINDEIESLHIPVLEFSTFIKDLKKLNNPSA